MVKLSVCVPTYNGSAFLRSCLASVLAQDEDLELLVGDDASTDDTLDVARGFADTRVRVHAFQSRAGLAGNWNRLLQLAQGEFVSLVGQDDHVRPTWAQTLVGLLDRHPEATLAFGRRAFAFEDDESRAAVGDFFEHRYPAMLAPFHAAIGELIPSSQMIEQAMRFCFEINLIGEPSFVVVRRDTPAVRAGFDAGMSQLIDWEFFTRHFVHTPIAHSPALVGTYRIHARAASIGNAPLARHYREFDHLLHVVRRRFEARLTAAQAGQLADRHREVERLVAEHG